MENTTKLTTADPSFDDIRPCNDSEVQSELSKIISDEMVINSILKFRYPLTCKTFGFLLRPIVRAYLRKKASHIKTIHDFQQIVANFVDNMTKTTTDGLELVGFDKLQKDTGYLFISNHRDISLDPAFIDIALFKSGLDTVRIAIGDNLLRIPAATSLMRLNRSFIDRKSVV